MECLNTQDALAYLALFSRVDYMAQDSAGVAFAVKELCWHVPTREEPAGKGSGA